MLGLAWLAFGGAFWQLRAFYRRRCGVFYVPNPWLDSSNIFSFSLAFLFLPLIRYADRLVQKRSRWVELNRQCVIQEDELLHQQTREFSRKEGFFFSFFFLLLVSGLCFFPSQLLFLSSLWTAKTNGIKEDLVIPPSTFCLLLTEIDVPAQGMKWSIAFVGFNPHPNFGGKGAYLPGL